MSNYKENPLVGAQRKQNRRLSTGPQPASRRLDFMRVAEEIARSADNRRTVLPSTPEIEASMASAEESAASKPQPPPECCGRECLCLESLPGGVADRCRPPQLLALLSPQQRREASAWEWFDWADSVYVIGTNLFFPTFLTELATQMGFSSPRSFWSFSSTIATVMSLLAYVVAAPLADYGDVKRASLRWSTVIGSVATVGFLIVVVPEMIYVGAALFVISKVASRVGGVMYDAMLYPTARGNEAVAHEISGRGVALGYVSMVLFFLLVGGAFLLPAQLSSSDSGPTDAEWIAQHPNKTIEYDHCGDLITGEPDTPKPESELWLEYRLPIAMCGLWWGLFAWFVSFPYLARVPGPPLPPSALNGKLCSAEPLPEESTPPAQNTPSPNIPDLPSSSTTPPPPAPPTRTWLSMIRYGLTQGVMEQVVAVRALGGMKDLGLFILAWVFLSDASSTATSSAALILADELCMSTIQIGMLGFVGMFTAASGVLVFKILVRRKILRPMHVLFLNITILTGCGLWANWASDDWEVFAIAALGGFNIGTIGSFTRSIFVMMVPKSRQARIAALYEFSQKGTSWLAPLAIGIAVETMGEDNYRTIVIVAVMVEVAIGVPILLFVDPDRGQRLAAAINAQEEGTLEIDDGK